MLKDVIIEALFLSGIQPLLRLVITTFCVYITLIVILRFFGSRSVSSLSVYDLITTFTIGSIIATTITSKDVSYLLGIGTVLTLLFLQYVVSKVLTKFPFLTSITNPPPTVVFFNGKFREDEMKKQRINEEEVFQAIRKKREALPIKYVLLFLSRMAPFP